jgi:bifunctional non-homologous end joining protein LigD
MNNPDQDTLIRAVEDARRILGEYIEGAARTGRSNDWVKKTCAQRETLTIAGYALDGSKFNGLYLGRRKGDDLVYAGKVDLGFDPADAKDLQLRMKPLIRKTQPYAKKIAHRGIWVESSLLAEIEYRAKSAEGRCDIHSSRVFARIHERHL